MGDYDGEQKIIEALNSVSFVRSAGEVPTSDDLLSLLVKNNAFAASLFGKLL
jgi:hypothetical protein